MSSEERRQSPKTMKPLNALVKVKILLYWARGVINRLRVANGVLRDQYYVYPKHHYGCHELSFSQEGEDCVLRRLFEHQLNGIYVDVGAHDPQRFSNTYKFYLRGWRGLNIDPLPGSKVKFDSLRPRDVNLQIGIADHYGLLTYHSFEEPAYNTFDKLVASKVESILLEKIDIPVRPLADILSEHLPHGAAIDFLSVDVEGLDESVLRSNDWSRWRPRFVLAETLGLRGVDEAIESPVGIFMASVGYKLYGKTVNTVFFVDRDDPLARI